MIQGYAYAGAFIGRAACDWSCEVTVYLDHTAHKCGYKFGHWYNVIWMEKIIGNHQENQPSVRFLE